MQTHLSAPAANVQTPTFVQNRAAFDGIFTALCVPSDITLSGPTAGTMKALSPFSMRTTDAGTIPSSSTISNDAIDPHRRQQPAIPDLGHCCRIPIRRRSRASSCSIRPASGSDARYRYRLGPYESQSLPDVMASNRCYGDRFSCASSRTCRNPRPPSTIGEEHHLTALATDARALLGVWCVQVRAGH
jgi:hypothetical protein